MQRSLNYSNGTPHAKRLRSARETMYLRSAVPNLLIGYAFLAQHPQPVCISPALDVVLSDVDPAPATPVRPAPTSAPIVAEIVLSRVIHHLGGAQVEIESRT